LTSQATINTSVQAAFAGAQAAITSVGTLEGASLPTLAPAIAAVSAALPVFDAAISSLDAGISTTTTGGVVAGQPAPDVAQALLQQTSDVQQEAMLLNARAYLRRVNANLAQAPG
jgi:hypothetical protein